MRAGEVKDLKQLNTYPFSGHQALMGKYDHGWQDTEYVLRFFAKTTRTATKAYTMFLAKGVSIGRRPELVGGGLIRSVGGWSALKSYRRSGIRIKGDERILGCSEFVQKTLEQANEQLAEKTRIQADGPDLEAVIEKVADYFQVDLEDLQSASKTKKVSRARSMLSYLAVRKLMISCADVARVLHVSPSTVSKAVIKGREAKDRNKIQKDILGI